jgi:hypothetical protein
LVRLLHNAECLSLEWFLSRPEAKVVIEGWRRHYTGASEHPSGYVIEEKSFAGRDVIPRGDFGFWRARSVMDWAADVLRALRAKIQGPSDRGWAA